MPNSKSRPEAPPRPQVKDGWVRKSELDAWMGRCLPLPTQVVSNEEFDPLPQTSSQRRVEQTLLEEASKHASRLDVSRRQFLQSAGGMAAAFAALNSVFGNFFAVEAAELFDPLAAQEDKPRFFIFDVQTHHVAMPWQAPDASPELLDAFLNLRHVGRAWNPELPQDAVMEDLHLENYVKEVFLDSETDVAVLSGLPSPTEESSVIPPDVMVKTRSWVNDLTGSRRVVSHGYFAPELGQRNLEAMQMQAEKLKIDAWKGYTGMAKLPEVEGWRIDDEKNSYPALELSRRLGIKNVCLHKGLPFPGDPKWWAPDDIVKASRDFPDLNFLVYHSGFKSLQDSLPAAEDGFQKSSYVPWVSDLCDWRRQNPHMTNVYMELGSTLGMAMATSPLLAAHMLGMIIQAFGEDHVLWGTDSIWWGSPQWQIEAFRRFQIPEDLMKRFGYQSLSHEVKARIFGLNAARLYGVDAEAMCKPIPEDYVDRLRKLYKESGRATPSNTQYGWVRAVGV